MFMKLTAMATVKSRGEPRAEAQVLAWIPKADCKLNDFHLDTLFPFLYETLGITLGPTSANPCCDAAYNILVNCDLPPQPLRHLPSKGFVFGSALRPIRPQLQEGWVGSSANPGHSTSKCLPLPVIPSHIANSLH